MAAVILTTGLAAAIAASRRRRARRRAQRLAGSRTFFFDRWWTDRELANRLETATGISLADVEAAIERDGIQAIAPYFHAAMELLVLDNVAYLEAHPETPGLYESGVRYRTERAGLERWLGIPVLYREGFGDCEDLVGARLAELAIAGTPGSSRLTSQPVGEIMLFHFTILRADGAIEDPSADLGMRRREAA